MPKAYAELEKKSEGIIAELSNDKKMLQEKMDRDNQEHLKLIQEMQQRSDKLVADAQASTSGGRLSFHSSPCQCKPFNQQQPVKMLQAKAANAAVR